MEKMNTRKNKEQLIKELEIQRRRITQLEKSEARLKGSRERLELLEKRYQSTMDNLLEGCQIIGYDWRYLYVNKAAAEHGRTSKEELIGRTMMEAYPGIENTEMFSKLRVCMDSRLPQHLENEFIFPDGTKGLFELIVEPVPEGIFILSLNITERKQMEMMVKQREEEVLKQNTKLHKVMEDAIQAISRICEIRDPYTTGHETRVTQLALSIAEEMKLTAEQKEGLRIAAAIHDIGKISVPAEILSKTGKLSDTELTIVKIHVQTGFEIIRTIDFSQPVADIVLQHHERLNGSGYPLGVSRNNILIEARILAVADVVEAMSSHRPYRPAMGIDKALEEITMNKGILYDADVVEACLRVFKEKCFEFQE